MRRLHQHFMLVATPRLQVEQLHWQQAYPPTLSKQSEDGLPKHSKYTSGTAQFIWLSYFTPIFPNSSLSFPYLEPYSTFTIHIRFVADSFQAIPHHIYLQSSGASLISRMRRFFCYHLTLTLSKCGYRNLLFT